jgi:hypothetical protein
MNRKDTYLRHSEPVSLDSAWIERSSILNEISRSRFG